mgnify:CR=1 FL=1
MSNTTNLGLFKHDNPPTNENQFDVEKSLNENWDKIDEFAGEQKDINSKVIAQGQQIENLNKQYTQLNQGLQSANMKIEILDDLKAGKVETEEQFRKIYTDQERQDKQINGLKDSAINITTDKQKSLHIEDSSNMPAKINIFGNSEQETRQGYNLANYNNSSNSTQYNFNIGDIVNGKAYTLYLNIPTANISFNLRYDVQDGEKILEKTNLTGKQCINFTSNKDGILFFNGYNFTSGYKGISEIMLLEGTYSSSNVPEFEKYGASPSPQFPSPIKNVGDNINLINEENLLNYTPYGATVTSTVIQASTTRRGYLFECKPNTAYTIQRGDTTAPSFRGFCFDENPIENPQAKSTNGAYADTLAGPVGKKITFKTTANSKYIYVVTSTNEYTTPSVKAEEGEIATSYSPYNCGNIGINKTNSNILPQFEETKETQTLNGVTITKNSDGTYTLNGTSTGVVDLILFGSWTSEGVKLRLNKGILYFKTNSTKINGSINCFSKSINKSFSINVNSYFNNQVVEDISYVFIRLCTGAGVTFNNENVILELSYDDVDNLEVNKNDKIVFPLKEGQRLMLGDYPGTDEKIHHVRKQIVLDGTENCLTNSEGANYYSFNITDYANIVDKSNNINIMCNMLKPNASTIVNTLRIASSGNILIIVEKTFCEYNATSLKNKLKELYEAGTPIVIEIPLLQEETEDFTEEQKTAFEQLQNCDMYKPITNITTEDNMALIEAQYIADTKTYIDNKYNNLAQQIINQIAGGN